jgi:hypothetical protein
MTEPTQQFWMVFNPRSGAPTVRHPTKEKAETEARRLARKCPGETFFVLEAICAVTKREFDVTEFRRAKPVQQEVDVDIPF